MIKLMNQRGIRVLLIAMLAVVAPCVGQSTKRAAKDSCWDTANTQAELNSCAESDAKKADAELNRIYSLLLGKLKSDPVALESMKESERQWIRYRDAEEKALHPHLEDEGSVHPMCVASELAQLTNERVKLLRRMLQPEEGDVCAYAPNER